MPYLAHLVIFNTVVEILPSAFWQEYHTDSVRSMEWLTFSRKQNRCKNLNLNHNLDWRMTRCHSESKHVDISAFVMRVACVRQELTAIVGHKALVSNKRQQQRYKLKPTSKDDFTDSRTRNSRSLSIGLKLLLVWRYFAQVMGYS